MSNARKLEAIAGLRCPEMFWAARALRWCAQRAYDLTWYGLGNLCKRHRAGDRVLQLLIFNEEFLVSASHQLVLITSLPFVHTTD